MIKNFKQFINEQGTATDLVSMPATVGSQYEAEWVDPADPTKRVAGGLTLTVAQDNATSFVAALTTPGLEWQRTTTPDVFSHPDYKYSLKVIKKNS